MWLPLAGQPHHPPAWSTQDHGDLWPWQWQASGRWKHTALPELVSQLYKWRGGLEPLRWRARLITWPIGRYFSVRESSTLMAILTFWLLGGPLLINPGQTVLARSQDVEEQAWINQFLRDRFPECTYGDTSWKIGSGQRRDGESTGMLSTSECRQPGAGTKQKNKKVINPGGTLAGGGGPCVWGTPCKERPEIDARFLTWIMLLKTTQHYP